MSDIGHAFDRFLLHFGWTAWLVPGIWFAMQMCIRRKWGKTHIWLPSAWRPQLLLSSVLVGLIPTLREPFDVWFGNQPGWKTIPDILSWILPAFLAGWGTYRILVRGAQMKVTGEF